MPPSKSNTAAWRAPQRQKPLAPPVADPASASEQMCVRGSVSQPPVTDPAAAIKGASALGCTASTTTMDPDPPSDDPLPGSGRARRAALPASSAIAAPPAKRADAPE